MIEPCCSVIQNSFESECMYVIIFKVVVLRYNFVTR